MITSCIILVIGAILTASAWAPHHRELLILLAIYRAILGFGIGGEYPNSATSSSEDSSNQNRGRNVLLVFSM